MASRTRRQLLSARKAKSPAAPTRLYATTASAGDVTLAWRSSAHRQGAKAAKLLYEVFRDGRRIGRTRQLRFVDTTAREGRTYRYEVRAVDADKRRSHASHPLKLLVLRPVAHPAAPSPAVGAVTTAAPPGASSSPAAAGPNAQAMSVAMVDRMLWRAGFGPSDDDRQQWTGKPVADLVDHLVSTSQSLDPTIPPPLTASNATIDPLATREEAVMEWLDTMVRARNPLTERLTLFWHDHWAVSRATGIPAQFMLAYRDRLRRYSDLGANPGATFTGLAQEMTTKDAAMSIWLNGFQNAKGAPNENYAREFQELFCLGVRDGAGNANYTQQDVTELARAFTGWRLDQMATSATYGVVSFASAAFDAKSKTIYGQTANWSADPTLATGSQSAVELVLSHPAHAPYVVTNLWDEFISAPIPADALAAGVKAYVDSGRQLKPVVTSILNHPLLFDSMDAPTMVKSPVVFLVGAMRALGAPQRGTWSRDILSNLGQIIYEPPNVAGWEGGAAWMDNNTAQSRFDAAERVINLKHLPVKGGLGYPGSVALPDPGADETAQQSVDAALAACGGPWTSAGTQAALFAFASAHPTATATNRLQRAYALRALVLGGPDFQVM